MQVARSGLYYERKMPSRDLPVIDVMKRLSGQYPRFGSRRIRVFLAREGLQIGKERCSRLWSQAGLQVPAKKKRRRAIASAAPRPKMPDQRNTVWSYDFVYDACANGQTIKCLTVVDEYTRECLAIDVAGSIRSKRGIDVLSRLICMRCNLLLQLSNTVTTRSFLKIGKFWRHRCTTWSKTTMANNYKAATT